MKLFMFYFAGKQIYVSNQFIEDLQKVIDYQGISKRKI